MSEIFDNGGGSNQVMNKINNWLLNKQVELEVRKMEAEDGQTMVEYGLVLVAVALVAYVAFTALGGRLTGMIGNITF
jgi:Flp pilus assembly pilin Flp